MFEKDQVRFAEGERKIYESSPGVGRAFCADCGTSLTYEGEWGGKIIVEFHVGTLDRPENVLPDRHVFYSEKLRWFDVADELPRYHASSAGATPVQFGP